MDVKYVVYGETALDQLLKWLRSTGQPLDVAVVIQKYLEILREKVVEDVA
ncbi:MAG: hypothetical protein HC837_18925 [Chloroflexaceae bacterium]|nr:hypothetical protein [Chloroflexaceae bacterium]